MKRIKEILKDIDFLGTAKAIGLVLLMMLVVSIFVFILMFSVKLASLLALAAVTSMGFPLVGRM